MRERRHPPVFPGFREMSDRRRALSEQLVERRQALGLSQTQVAARMGTSQSAVARLETGTTDVLLSTVDRYASALGWRLDWSLEDPGGPGDGDPGASGGQGAPGDAAGRDPRRDRTGRGAGRPPGVDAAPALRPPGAGPERDPRRCPRHRGRCRADDPRRHRGRARRPPDRQCRRVHGRGAGPHRHHRSTRGDGTGLVHRPGGRPGPRGPGGLPLPLRLTPRPSPPRGAQCGLPGECTAARTAGRRPRRTVGCLLSTAGRGHGTVGGPGDRGCRPGYGISPRRRPWPTGWWTRWLPPPTPAPVGGPMGFRPG